VHIVLLIFGVLVTVLGIGLLAIPAVPAIGIIFSGVVLVAWADGFARIGWAWLAVLLVLTVVGSLADNVATLFGARKAGASAWGRRGHAGRHSVRAAGHRPRAGRGRVCPRVRA
jgi:uncharacterized protein YqgC (DUF456 family)